MTAAAVALVAGVVGLSAVLAVQTQAKAEIAAALGRETQANEGLATANAELSASRAAVQARYDLAVEAIKTFHTGVSEDFLLKEEQFKELRDRLLKSAADFYGKLGALLGKETDVGLAAGAGGGELRAGRADRQGRPQRGRAGGAPGGAGGAARYWRPSRGPAPGEGRRRPQPDGRRRLLESTGKTDEALATYREAEALAGRPASGSPEARGRAGGLPVADGLAPVHDGKDDGGAGRLPPGAGRPGGAGRGRRGAEGGPARPGGHDQPASAALLAKTGRAAEAEAEYRTALAIRRKLADDNPAVTDSAAAWRPATTTSAGCCRRRAGRRRRRPSTARRWRSSEKLADDNPAVTDFRSSLAGSHINLGNPADRHGQAEGGGGRVPHGAGDPARSWPTTTPPSPNSAAAWRSATQPRHPAG